MWKLYGLAPRGVAIKSTVKSLIDNFRPHGEGPVVYYDPHRDYTTKSLFGPDDIRFKRISFEFEREYRMWFTDDDLMARVAAGEDVDKKTITPGRPVNLGNLQLLIQKIVVAPGASDRFLNSVKKVLANNKRRWLIDYVESSYTDKSWEDFAI
jgi:hypothetical protein